MNIEELMRYMLNLFNNTDKELQKEYERLSNKDLELSDLDHYIENNNLKSYEYAKVGKLRKTLREERRQIKNNIELIEIVKKFTDKYNNKLITGDIIQNLKEQERVNKRQNSPTYTYRTNILEKLKTKEGEENENTRKDNKK